jgi:hypothetical protein
MSVRATLKSIPAEGSRTFLDFLRKWPGTHDSAVWKMFLAGGAVASVARRRQPSYIARHSC